MFDLGMQELIVIFIVALIVFGPKRLPELGRTIGKGIHELRRAVSGVKDQIDEEMKEVREPLLEARDFPDAVDSGERDKEESTEGKDTEEEGRDGKVDG